MRGILLASFLMCFLFAVELQATPEMAKSSSMRCNQCHKGRDIPTQGVPPLKSKGISHLRKLVTLQGYIPKHNYSQLDNLAATIEANRKKLESPNKNDEASKTPNTESQNASEVSSNTNPEAPGPMQKAEEIVVNGTTEANQNFSQDSANELAQPLVKTNRTQNQSATSNVKDAAVTSQFDQRSALNISEKSRKVMTNDDGKVQFKGGKTFILKRPEVKPGTRYSWEEDWSFDDYY